MTSKQARMLRKRWGNKDCEHLSFEPEYFCGTFSGNYICKKCGRSFLPKEKNDIQAMHKMKEKEK